MIVDGRHAHVLVARDGVVHVQEYLFPETGYAVCERDRGPRLKYEDLRPMDDGPPPTCIRCLGLL